MVDEGYGSGSPSSGCLQDERGEAGVVVVAGVFLLFALDGGGVVVV